MPWWRDHHERKLMNEGLREGIKKLTEKRTRLPATKKAGSPHQRWGEKWEYPGVEQKKQLVLSIFSWFPFLRWLQMKAWKWRWTLHSYLFPFPIFFFLVVNLRFSNYLAQYINHDMSFTLLKIYNLIICNNIYALIKS